MNYQIYCPHRFRERLLIFGYEGAGKSSTILNILRYDTTAHAWIMDLDYSYAYERLIATEYQDVADRVHIFQIDTEWTTMHQVFRSEIASSDGYTLNQHNPDTDWLVIDPTTATWGMVQKWWLESAYGEMADTIFAQLRIDAAARVEAGVKSQLRTKSGTVDSEYAAEKADTMQWPIINEQYNKHFYQQLHKWRGHMILVCEADSVRKDASPAEQDQYGWLGHKPKGQKTLPFVAATNIYFAHPKQDLWTLTTVKDRGRPLMDKVPVSDFAFQYLVDVAGWGWTEVEDTDTEQDTQETAS